MSNLYYYNDDITETIISEYIACDTIISEDKKIKISTHRAGVNFIYREYKEKALQLLTEYMQFLSKQISDNQIKDYLDRHSNIDYKYSKPDKDI